MSEALEKFRDQCKKEGERIGEKRGEKRATVATNRKAVENLMNKMALTLDQALNVLDIQGEERSMVEKQILR